VATRWKGLRRGKGLVRGKSSNHRRRCGTSAKSKSSRIQKKKVKKREMIAPGEKTLHIERGRSGPHIEVALGGERVVATGMQRKKKKSVDGGRTCYICREQGKCASKAKGKVRRRGRNSLKGDAYQHNGKRSWVERTRKVYTG